MRNRSENQIGLALIRHGETPANRERRYLGWTDEPLSERGREILLSQRTSYPKVQALFSSPMKRCLKTAEILYPEMRPVVIPEWREMDFGRFEYRSYEELKGDGQYQAWIDSNGTLPFPEGEGREEFVARCERGFWRMLQMLEQKGLYAAGLAVEARAHTVGIIVHGGTIMALLSRYYGGDYFDYQVHNGGGYLCRFRGQGTRARITEIQKF